MRDAAASAPSEARLTDRAGPGARRAAEHGAPMSARGAGRGALGAGPLPVAPRPAQEAECLKPLLIAQDRYARNKVFRSGPRFYSQVL